MARTRGASRALATRLLLELPPELLAECLSRLDGKSCARLACVARVLHAPLESALRLRAARAGVRLPLSLPRGASSCIPTLLSLERRRALTREVVAAGNMHMCFIDANSHLRSCGVERFVHTNADAEDDIAELLGLTGHGKLADPAVGVPVPTLVPGLVGVRIVAVSVSFTHSLAVSDDGVMFSWGYGWGGQLGHLTSKDELQPRPVEALSDVRVTAVAAGLGYSMAICDVPHTVIDVREDITSAQACADEAEKGTTVVAHGCLFSWGCSSFFGLGQPESLIEPGFDSCLLTPSIVPALSEIPVKMVQAGNFSLALTKDGAVWSWGTGIAGRLGHGDTNTAIEPRRIRGLAHRVVTSIAAGDAHSLAVDQMGAVWSWGCAALGQLGHGDSVDVLVPRQIMSLNSWKVTTVAAGKGHNVAGHSLCVTEQGTVFSWGGGEQGR